ncbi:MAG: NF038122 family metalloprotease [Planctomycetes bacterium]|nr:NF038122 family metalloprotease [Planctomycetota bacterium]
MVHLTRVAATLIILVLGVSTAPALTFNFTNQGGATPQMMAGVAQAGALWSAHFHDAITVNIRIHAAALPLGVIGHTDSFFDPYSYTNVRGALVSDRLSTDDLSSSNNLQAGSTFSMLINRTANNPNGVVSATPYFDTGLGGPGQAGPENNNTVRITSANAKALGLYPAHSAGLDATITFSNQNIFDFDRSNGINAAQIDFLGATAHELGHALGFISGVDTLAGNGNAPGLNDNQLRFLTPLDLFRFSTRSIGAGGGLGVNDWTADDTTKYFSVDGGSTSIVPFSTGAIYEESHWKNNLGIGIMNPTVSVGTLLQISDNDLRAFDVIGYDFVTLPEPSTRLLSAVGLIGVALFACGKLWRA